MKSKFDRELVLPASFSIEGSSNKWSYTKLKTLNTCPLKFYLKYVIFEKPTDEIKITRRGIEIHSIIEEIVNKGIYKSQNFEHNTNYMQLWLKYYDVFKEYDIKGLISWLNIMHNLGYSINSEVELSNNIEEVQFTGKADIIMENDYSTIIVDIKTGMNKSDSQTFNYYSAQLALYESLYNKKAELRIVYLRPFEVKIIDNRQAKEKLYQELKILSKKEHIIKASRNSLCNYCEYKSLCKRLANEILYSRVNSGDDNSS